LAPAFDHETFVLLYGTVHDLAELGARHMSIYPAVHIVPNASMN
jgi:hypothetical protein